MTAKIQLRSGLIDLAGKAAVHTGPLTLAARTAFDAVFAAPVAEMAADKPIHRGPQAKDSLPDTDTESDVKPIQDFSAALGEWGVGYANLVSFEDREFSYMIAGDRASGTLTVIEQGAVASTVKAQMAADAFLTNLLYWGGGQANSLGGMLSPTGITTFRMNGESSCTAKGAADIFGGSAAEMLVGSAARDLIRGGAGNDSIMGRGGSDIAWGGAGVDQLMGHDGADQLWGGAGNDVIDGGEDADFLAGGSGADRLIGGDGGDAMIGGSGADRLEGGDGHDLLLGGAGADSLTGGAGQDHFLLTQLDLSATAAERVDTITDFEIGVDEIDLTGFVETLSIVGAFTKTAFEVTLETTSTGTTVRLDIDGDGAADLELQVTTTTLGPISADDFIF